VARSDTTTTHQWKDIAPGSPQAHRHPYYEVLFSTIPKLLGRVDTDTGNGLTGQEIALGRGLEFSGLSLQANPQQVAPIDYVTRSIPAAAGESAYKWRRIAFNGPLVYGAGAGGSRATARFIVAEETGTGGGSDYVVFYAGMSNDAYPILRIEDNHRGTGSTMIRKVRMCYGSTYAGGYRRRDACQNSGRRPFQSLDAQNYRRLDAASVHGTGRHSASLTST
jgi:hypothetical protein